MAVPPFIRENIPLRSATTIRIGGPARWFAEPGNMDELRLALAFAGEIGVGVKMLGGGSNLLVADAGVDAMVIRLSREGEFAALRRGGEDPLTWHVGAAVPLAALVDEAARNGLSGMEGLAGIPGGIGGAAAMNCGSSECGVGDLIVGATVCDYSGGKREMTAGELDFSYRRSGLGRCVAVAFEVRFAAKGDPGEIARRTNEFRARKRELQPVGRASAGCFFRNPDGRSAGALIDAAGCKGMSVGDAEVSAVHANFIVNRGRATCAETVELARTVRGMVRDRFGVTLEPEVAMWGDDGAFVALREDG